MRVFRTHAHFCFVRVHILPFHNGDKRMNNLFSAFVLGLLQDATNDAYQQELQDHPDEGVPTHVAHAIGRFFGQMLN
jgi:hypothetical protein